MTPYDAAISRLAFVVGDLVKVGLAALLFLAAHKLLASVREAR